ncbi:Lrp/AsnC family transcriptional regulator [Paenibacillus oenotherae]|uniref:Lrp/AsnC family transcriptional regulator n=1 Tax=Paenibacillus oenotherae TaxID=1435645 RepID=A0ABS7D1U5_9BACL|nr:Lrp/AsnC family transcriptional regulator [Paenibacillus oenotherae]MBW7473912.1 Lrp/AsnC family transcriptional regulator [Paenibacillus oenotherae]
MIDSTDMMMIKMLLQNSRIQWKEIGELVHMSAPAVTNRINKLEKAGIIEGYTVKLNERLLGNNQCIFIVVMMKDYRHTKFTEFIKTRDEIKEAHRVSGEPCFILKVQLADPDLLANLLDEILTYGHYKINISIDQVK